ncbi:MAG: rRNA maturation RNase YbeY [Elusimicrobiota bacterium]|nr:rRNA maturation RNase YbeY [Elusimicrobiota bacterium]
MGREVRLTVRVAGLSALPAAARAPRLFEEAVRLACGRASGEVSVVVLPRAKMRAMNREYLGHDYDTDVIAFRHERVPGVPPAESPYGDVYLSAWMARRQAAELGHSVLREALTLAAHGALHLAGHDDGSPAERARMFRAQDRILARLRV